MGLDYRVKFKNKIKYNGRSSDNFSPFSRSFSQLIGNHLNNPESLLLKIESTTSAKLQFVTSPNLYDYIIEPMLIEFASGKELEELLKRQEKLDVESVAAWHVIDIYSAKLLKAISVLKESEKLKSIEYDREWWLDYLESDELINDLNGLSELLHIAKRQGQTMFSYIII